MTTRHKVFALIVLWAIAVCLGVNALMIYKGKPGAVGETPKTWLKNDLISQPSDKPLLVMFAHPRCPCTKASLGELESLVAKAKDNFEAVVLFYQPTDSSLKWTDSPTISLARSIPGVRVISDKEGRVADLFQAQTSGHTVVYDQHGKLLFSGGITGSRGHLGDNAGYDAVLKIVNSTSPSQRTAKVFGCGIF